MGDLVTQGLFLFFYYERTITDVADTTGYTVERIKEIVLYDSSPTAIEAEIIFKMFGINIAEIISY